MKRWQQIERQAILCFRLSTRQSLQTKLDSLGAEPSTAKPKLEPENKKGKVHCALSLFHLEREKSLELSTYTLARYRSTN
jgi:hypothetical protein